LTLQIVIRNATDNSERTTPGSALKRKAAASPEINCPLTKFSKMTPSSGPKRPPRPQKDKSENPQQPTVAKCVKVVKLSGRKVKAVAYTRESVLAEWSATTEYGNSFRGLTPKEQDAEVEVLNKSSAKGMKNVVKNTLLATQYKLLIGEKMRLYFYEQRESQATMMHAVQKVQTGALARPEFLSVGEWVEVDADRTPGYNSEGGIGVITAVHDALADIK
jgi:hypothetical protein